MGKALTDAGKGDVGCDFWGKRLVVENRGLGGMRGVEKRDGNRER